MSQSIDKYTDSNNISPSWETPWDGVVSANGQTEKVIKKRWSEVYTEMRKIYPEESWPECMWLWENKMTSKPRCFVCGSELKFHGRQKGYGRYCSKKCANSDQSKKDKSKTTCMEKYGVWNPMQSNELRSKAQATCLERYGVGNPFASDEVKERIKETMQEKYGVDYALQSQEVREKRKKNSMEKYGVEHPSKMSSIKKKISKSNRERVIESNESLIGYGGLGSGQWICKCPHPECAKCSEKYYIIWPDQYYARKEFDIEPCTNILPVQKSHNQGTTLELFVRKILDEYNIKYIYNNRSILSKKELDIYIPDKHIAFECNGLRWHSYPIKYPKYHMNKWISCKEKGIQLVTLWEDQIRNNPDVVKDIILSKLGIYNIKIYARKCTIVELTPDETTAFLNENHIQGKVRSTVKLGLRYEGNLVAVMTFSKRSSLSGGQSDSNSWELTRYCTIRGSHVIGGAGKLLEYFKKKYAPKKIVSFSSNDISDGGMYRSLGFKEKDMTSAYWYVRMSDMKRYHRTSFSKHRLSEMGYDIKNKTEDEIMRTLPYWKIWDSGHIRWEYI